MRELGFIDARDGGGRRARSRCSARAHRARCSTSRRRTSPRWRACEVRQRFGAAAESAGYKVYTTIDGRLQTAANRAVRIGLIEYDRRHGWRGPLGQSTSPQRARPTQLEALLDEYSAVGMLLPAVVVSVRREDRRACYIKSRGVRADRLGRHVLGAQAPRAARRSGPRPKSAARNRRAAATSSTWSPTARATAQLAQIPEAQSALVALDPNDGAIVALVGGFDYFTEQVQPRDPGAAPARLGLQAVPVFGGAGEWLHAGVGACSMRRSCMDEATARRRPGARRTPAAISAARRGCAKRWCSRATWSRSACCGDGHAVRRSTTSRASASPSATLPQQSDAGARHACRRRRWRSPPATRCSPTAAIAIEPYFIDRIENAAGQGRLSGRAAHRVRRLRAAGRSAGVRRRARRSAGASAARGRAARRPRRLCRRSRLAERVITPQNACLMTDMMADVITRGTGRRALALGPHGPRRQDRHHQRIRTTPGSTASTPDLVATVWVGFDQDLARRGRGRRAAPRCRSGCTSCAKRLKGVPEQPPPDARRARRDANHRATPAARERRESGRDRSKLSWPTTAADDEATWRDAAAGPQAIDPTRRRAASGSRCRSSDAMKQDVATPRADNLRRALAQEAARIMAEHGIRDFLLAKRKAAERFGVTDGAVLPKNIEIEDGAGRISAAVRRRRARRDAARAAPARRSRRCSMLQRIRAAPGRAGAERHRHRAHRRAAAPVRRRAESVAIRLMDRGIPHEVAERRVRYRAERVLAYPGVHFELDDQSIDATVFPIGRHPAGAGEPGGRQADAARRRRRSSKAAGQPRSADAQCARRSLQRPLQRLSIRLVVALRRAGVELARAADAHRRIGNHLLPVRHPAHGARDREHHGEHRARNAERAVDDARVEIHVRVELARDEVFVLERDLLEAQRELEQRVVRAAELLPAPCGTCRE